LKIEDYINNIYLGDSLQIMKQFPDKSIDWILTSPPYKDDEVPEDYYQWFSKVLKEFNRIVKHYSLIFNSSTRLIEICKRYNPERILIWYKGILKYAYRYEPIFIFNHGSNIKINKRLWTDTFKFQPMYGNRNIGWGRGLKFDYVPYSNPVQLYKGILRMIGRKGDIVLDPFIGSGTTALACRELGIDFIGIEINEKYYKIACEKLKQYVPTLDQFTEEES